MMADALEFQSESAEPETDDAWRGRADLSYALRAQIAREYSDSPKRVVEIIREHGIAYSTLYRLLDEFDIPKRGPEGARKSQNHDNAGGTRETAETDVPEGARSAQVVLEDRPGELLSEPERQVPIAVELEQQPEADTELSQAPQAPALDFSGEAPGSAGPRITLEPVDEATSSPEQTDRYAAALAGSESIGATVALDARWQQLADEWRRTNTELGERLADTERRLEARTVQLASVLEDLHRAYDAIRLDQEARRHGDLEQIPLCAECGTPHDNHDSDTHVFREGIPEGSKRYRATVESIVTRQVQLAAPSFTSASLLAADLPGTAEVVSVERMPDQA